MGRFIADFYCSECQLVIEVDGSSHEGQEHRDAARTEVMEQFGCRLVRFSNEEVLDDLSGVLKQIRTVCGEA